MSVEKLSDAYQVIPENVPFAQISNFVIEHIKDNDAFRVWAFSFSKSRDWKVIKEFTQKICGVGKRKADYVWSYLNRCGLVEYEKISDKETGKYIETRIRILNGTKFNPHEPFIKEKTTPAKNADMVTNSSKSVDKSTPALSASADMYPLLKKDITNKEKEREGSRKKRAPLSIFKPDKESTALAKDLKLDLTAELKSFENRHKGKKTQYEFQRWLKSAFDYNQKSKASGSKIEVKSTVPEYGPGHPVWEMNHGKRDSVYN